jgi:hypothetical protein
MIQVFVNRYWKDLQSIIPIILTRYVGLFNSKIVIYCRKYPGSKKAKPVKTGGAKPWVYRIVQDSQAAEGLFCY